MIIEWRDWIERYVYEVAPPSASGPAGRRGRRSPGAPDRRRGRVRLEGRSARPTDRPREDLRHGRSSGGRVSARPDQTVLVGPRILPFFWKCAAGVLFVHLAFTALWLRGFHTVTYLLPFRFAFTGSTTWMDIVFGAIANFGLVVLIFAAIQRWAMGAPSHFPSLWDPRELAPLPVSRPFASGSGPPSRAGALRAGRPPLRRAVPVSRPFGRPVLDHHAPPPRLRVVPPVDRSVADTERRASAMGDRAR